MQFATLDFKDIHLWPVLPRVLLCCLAVAVGILTSWHVYGKASWGVLRQEQVVEMQLRQELQNNLDKTADYHSLRQRHEQMQQWIHAAEASIRQPAEMLSLLTKMSQIGASRSLRVEWIRPSPEVAAAHYAERPVTLMLTGQFHDIGRFVADLTNLPSMVVLQQLLLRSTRHENILALEATAKIYRYLEPEEKQPLHQRQKSQ